MSALKEQVSGDHYKNMAIQPVEFITANNMTFLEGCIVKRISRYRKAGGKGREDILKLIHEAQLLLELSYQDAHQVRKRLIDE